MSTVKVVAPTIAYSSLRIAERMSCGWSGLRLSGGWPVICRGLLLGVVPRSAPDEQRIRQWSTERVSVSVLVCDCDHAVQGAHFFYGEHPSGDQPTLSQV